MTPHVGERRYAIVEAPSVLDLKPTGVDRLARTLLETGLAERLNGRYTGRVEPVPYSPNRDAETGTLNARAIAQWSPRLADAIGQVLDTGELPLVLGGDCSILLGAMLALKRRGRYGLLFIDGHHWRLDADWRAQFVIVERWSSQGHGRLRLERAGTIWRVDGELRPDLEGADEPDLSVTPFCNAFPILPSAGCPRRRERASRSTSPLLTDQRWPSRVRDSATTDRNLGGCATSTPACLAASS